jgi:hypothetical protein
MIAMNREEFVELFISAGMLPQSASAQASRWKGRPSTPKDVANHYSTHKSKYSNKIIEILGVTPDVSIKDVQEEKALLQLMLSPEMEIFPRLLAETDEELIARYLKSLGKKEQQSRYLAAKCCENGVVKPTSKYFLLCKQNQ